MNNCSIVTVETGYYVVPRAPPCALRIQSSRSSKLLISTSFMLWKPNSRLLPVRENDSIFWWTLETFRIFALFTEFEQRVMIRFLYWGGSGAWDIYTRLSAQFGDAASGLQSVHCWYLYTQHWRECWMMRPDLEDRQLIVLVFRFCLHLKNNLFTRPCPFMRSSVCRTRQFWTGCATGFTWNICICGGISTSWLNSSELQEFRNARSCCHC
jgi:hypothetical protein